MGVLNQNCPVQLPTTDTRGHADDQATSSFLGVRLPMCFISFSAQKRHLQSSMSPIRTHERSSSSQNPADAPGPWQADLTRLHREHWAQETGKGQRVRARPSQSQESPEGVLSWDVE